jgi:hypothetical protein
MKTILRSMLVVVVVGLAVTVLAYATGGHDKSAAQADVTPTPYHEGYPSPAASPVDNQGHGPLPGPQDQTTANAMTNAGITMTQAAQSMEAAAAIMVASGNPTLVDLGGHWRQDARALRDRGAWMIMSATSDSMIHDPDKAREVDVANLQANGATMEAEGNAMADHGRAMIAQVERLRTDGSLPAGMADDLVARGKNLIAAGEQMARDGEQMQEYAKNLQRSLGK